MVTEAERLDAEIERCAIEVAATGDSGVLLGLADWLIERELLLESAIIRSGMSVVLTPELRTGIL